MADVEMIHVTRAQLLARRVEIDAHIAGCCAAQDGTCRQLEELGNVQYLLGEDGDKL